ncbi:dna replication checkpoint tel2, partial [Fusarium heterosporum]
MDDLLTPVSTTYLKPRNDPEPLFTEIKTTTSQEKQKETGVISTADDAIDALRNQPDYDSLISVLQFLDSHRTASAGFSLSAPSPKNASVIHLLITEIAPNYWTLLREGNIDGDAQYEAALPPDAGLFLSCLRNLTGLNAVITQIRGLIQEARLGGKEQRRTDLSLNIGILLSVLSGILGTDGAIPAIWNESTRAIANTALQRIQSQKLSSILTNGQIVSTSAEALEIIGRDRIRDDIQWLGDGLQYSTWIGNSIVSWTVSSPGADGMAFSSELFQKSLSLQHSENLIKIAIDRLLLSKERSVSAFTQLGFSQPRSSKRVINILLRHLAQKYLKDLTLDDISPDEKVSAVAGLVKELVLNDVTRRDILINWCASSSGAGLGDGIGIRRAVVAALSQDRDAITAVLEKCLTQFGDELYIRHSAILQQDVHTQLLLLAAGYVHRISPIKLTLLMRVGTYMTTISNRIGSTQSRAQFLGLVVGESLSALVDDGKKKLDFKMEQTQTEEAQQLKSLTKVSDTISSIDPILSNPKIEEMPQKRKSAMLNKTVQKKTTQKKKPVITEAKPKAIIEEIDSSEDEDLAPYSKDSDQEDSDDDATLVQRNKPKPPVYIRDLVSYLRDSESYDKQILALQTAPVLIRRKANYGSESLTSSFLAPLAAEAADTNTGPDVLKLQTFTARYKSKTKSKPRVRAIPNTTAALLATSFFSPLTAHFQVALRSAKPIILNHALLSLYLQTLGITIHAAGPSTLSLPQLTAELWDLLLG